ncbi:MAG: molybdenum cofactor biosynthesis protein MoaE [Methanobacteriaceae archaeon]|nr:molybdenum cofactor biosynthesis protein MoaE [Methanobacteriaceae archaeon]
MLIKIIKNTEDLVTINDLITHVENNNKIDHCGAIYTFQGIVRGNEKGKKIKRLDLSTPNIEKTENELELIVKDVKKKYKVVDIAVVHYVGEFHVGDPLFLVAVAGSHRNETIEALNEIIERTKFELDFKKEEHTGTGMNIIMSGG